MTKTDAFRLIIKSLGIYCFIDFLFTLVPNISYSVELWDVSLTVNTIYLIVIFLITYLLLFQTERIIKVFRLAKGFDNEEIEIKVKIKDLYKLAIVIIGLLLIVDNIASFLNYCYLAFKKEVSATGLADIEGAMHDQFIDYNWWVMNGLNVLIGTVIILNHEKLASLFIKKEE